MSITADDWDDLTEARDRRERLRSSRPASAPVTRAIAAAAPDQTAPTPISRSAAFTPERAATEPEPVPVLGLAVFADDDYGDVGDRDLRIPAAISGANALIWLVGILGGVVECIGVAFFVSIGLLLAAYLMRVNQRDRSALILLAGALPLPLTIAGYFL